jgi:hypothetical protein
MHHLQRLTRPVQYAFAGQYQQSPTPRKGGIFDREYWQPYVPPTTGSRKGMRPDFDFMVVSVDSAFTEKEENDPTGCTTWGIWVDPTDGYPKVTLITAWRKHLPIHGEDQESQERGESDADCAVHRRDPRKAVIVLPRQGGSWMYSWRAKSRKTLKFCNIPVDVENACGYRRKYHAAKVAGICDENRLRPGVNPRAGFEWAACRAKGRRVRQGVS